VEMARRGDRRHGGRGKSKVKGRRRWRKRKGDDDGAATEEGGRCRRQEGVKAAQAD